MVMLETRTLLLYFSGSGSTKMIAEIVANGLRGRGRKVDLLEISAKANPKIIDKYDNYIIGTPTYHCAPPKYVVNFLNKLFVQGRPKNAYLFATCGLYPGNNLRTIAKLIRQKNIMTIGHRHFVGPASDGSLMFPSFIESMFQYEKNIAIKLDAMLDDMVRKFNDDSARVYVPRFKLYALLDWVPNRLIARNVFRIFFKPNIRVLPERWSGDSIDDVDPARWDLTGATPRYINNPEHDFDLRCVHRNPNKAVIFANWMKDKRRLDKSFYLEHKHDIVKKMRNLG
jgi:hypothetical protein